MLPSQEVVGNEFVVIDAEDVVERAQRAETCRSLSDGLEKLSHALDGRLQANSQVDHGDVVDGNSDRDTGELAGKFWQNELNSCRGASGCWDDVRADSTT